MIVSTDTLLNIIIPGNNKALDEVLKETQKTTGKAESKQLLWTLKDKNIQDLLKNIFNDAINNTKSNETILNLLKNSTVFKELGNFTNELKSLLNLIKSDNNLSGFQNSIKNFLTNIENSDDKTLKEMIAKSGVFLESKLLQSATPQDKETTAQLKSNISHDIKAVLLQLQEEIQNSSNIHSKEILKQVDKLLLQVDYYQLLSYSSSSNYIYFPFMWEQLEDGSLNFKQLEEEKFYCEINLKLKSYGKLKIMLILYKPNNLNLSIFTEQDKLKRKVQENIQFLKQALNKINLIPSQIKLLDLKDDDTKAEKKNIYGQNEQIGFGVNIKA